MRQHDILRFLDSVRWFGLRKIYWILRQLYTAVKQTLVDARFIFPQYSQSLIKRRISRKLIEEYNGDEGHNINKSQYFLGFGLVHYAFVRNSKPKNILCIGSRKGYVPALLALACKDNDMGRVDFVDAGYDRDQKETHWSGIGFWKKIDPALHFSHVGVKDYITTHVMTTREYAKKFPTRRYQYIYIDGDHSFIGVSTDYRLFWPQLDAGGFMAFHDVVARGYLDKGLFGVWKLWNRIGQRNGIVFPFPKESGLGIVQKK